MVKFDCVNENVDGSTKATLVPLSLFLTSASLSVVNTDTHTFTGIQVPLTVSESFRSYACKLLMSVRTIIAQYISAERSTQH
jgi:hypothetical protein